MNLTNALRIDMPEDFAPSADMLSGEGASMMTSVAASMMTSVASSMMTSVASSMMTSVASAAMTSVAQDEREAAAIAGKFAGQQTFLMTSVAEV